MISELIVRKRALMKVHLQKKYDKWAKQEILE